MFGMSACFSNFFMVPGHYSTVWVDTLTCDDGLLSTYSSSRSLRRYVGSTHFPEQNIDGSA